MADGPVERYFASNAPFWNGVYAGRGVVSATIRRRQAIAIDWIDLLHLEAGARALDVGCGARFLSVALARRGLAVQAIDPVAAMVAQARRSAEAAGVGRAINVRLGDAHQLDTADGTFALACSSRADG